MKIYRTSVMRSFCIIVSAVTLMSCSSRLPAPYEINNGGHLLVGLETHRIPTLQSFELDIHRIGAIPLTGSAGVIRLCRNGCEKPDYEDSSSLGVSTSRRMPTGKYVITGIRATFLELQDGFGFYSLKTRQNLNIPFKIEAGQTSYLGRYKLEEFVRADNTYIFSGGRGVVDASEKLSADRQLALKKMPGLYELTASYLPDESARKMMQNVSKIDRKNRRTISVIRSELPTDGKEYDGCTWWCE